MYFLRKNGNNINKKVKGGIIMKLKDCMENQVYCLKPENTIKDCAKMMCDNHIGCVPICDDEKCIVGIVTDRDVILRGIACDKDYKTTPLSEIMTTKICCCNYNEEINEAERLMADNQIRRMPIIDDNKKIVGIITLGDLARNNGVSNNDVSNTFEDICKYDHKNAQ